MVVDSPLRNYLIVDHDHRQVIAKFLEIRLVRDVYFMEGIVSLRVSVAEVLEHSCNVSLCPLAEVAANSGDHLDVNVVRHGSRLCQ